MPAPTAARPPSGPGCAESAAARPAVGVDQCRAAGPGGFGGFNGGDGVAYSCTEEAGSAGMVTNEGAAGEAGAASICIVRSYF
jgi:hypothetical protein